MCGICGFYSTRTITREHLKTMNDSLRHRGPDDHGEEIYQGREGYFIGMAHRRLSILDLSDSGHQPMQSFDGRVSVVFNGEIYNYRKLKQQLNAYPFHTSCDTEVILAAYLKWGIRCVEHFNGMFALCIYDRKTHEMFLARDRIGKKPLYYWTDRSGGAHSIVFASELKPIMLCPGFQKKIRTQVIPRFLYQQYINAPETVFEDVYKLEPGSILRFSNGQAEHIRYWDIAKVYHKCRKEPVSDYCAAREGLKTRLTEAVRRRMEADVPAGTLLSGGYDSSLVTAVAQEIAGAVPVKTFSVGFMESQTDESEYAKAVAGYLGTDHAQIQCTQKDLIQLLEDSAGFFDEPFADPSLIPTMAVSKFARQDVTVCLSGDGGDEFFCGYGYYPQVKWAQRLDMPGEVMHLLGNAVSLNSLKERHTLEEKFPMPVRIISQNRDRKTKTQIRSESYARCVKQMIFKAGGGSSLPLKYDEGNYGVPDWQIRRMLLDMDTYLPGDILTKIDRASMKYSLECRCPILDPDVMEYSFRLPQRFKCRGKRQKMILKDLAHAYIPKELMDRPKMGFNIPLDQWMRSFLKDQISSYADTAYLKKQGIFHPSYCNKLIHDYLKNGNAGNYTGKNYQNICWNFFLFQKWYEYWCS